MALVEAVAGELVHQLEDHRPPGSGETPLLVGAGDEAGPLLVHLLLLLLAHGAAQKVGLAQAVAGQDLGDLHHLLLVDDDAVGVVEHRLQQRMQHVDRLAADLAVDMKRRDVVHRARPIEGAEGGDVLDASWGAAGAGCRACPALRAGRPRPSGRSPSAHRSWRRRAAGRPCPPPPRAAPGTCSGPVDDGEGLQAEEVELHQAGALDPLHVELGGGQCPSADRGRAAPARSAAGRR